MTALKALAGQRELLLVGDSKLLSRGNIIAMHTAKVAFIAPASKAYLPTEVLGGLDIEQASPVDYAASRDAAKPLTQRGTYRVLEGTIRLPAKRGRGQTEPELQLRCVFVWSSARAQAAVASRAKKLSRATDDLERLERGWAAATIAGPTRSASASRSSPGAARSPPTYAPRSAPTPPPASRPLPGPSTRPPWTPTPPAMAGMGC